MRYLSALPGTFIALIVIIFADLFLPKFGNSTDVEIILTLSTFLFAILSGFVISRLTSRYDGIRNNVGSEDSILLSLYKTSQHISKKHSGKMAELIDKYYILSYDFTLSNAHLAYKKTAPVLIEMWDEQMKIDIQKNSSAYQAIVTQLTTLEDKRNMASVTSAERLGIGNWIILLTLAMIILVSVFYIRADLLYTHFITIALSTVLVLIILIIRDLQNLMLGGTSLLEESGQEVLNIIGKPRYYHESFVRRGIAKPPKGTPYRLGHHEPGTEPFNIEFVKGLGEK